MSEKHATNISELKTKYISFLRDKINKLQDERNLVMKRACQECKHRPKCNYDVFEPRECLCDWCDVRRIYVKEKGEKYDI